MPTPRKLIRTFLRSHGMTSGKEVRLVSEAYDHGEKVFPIILQPGERLYQYVRMATYLGPGGLGRWFCLRHATMDAVAITSGLGGRALHAFEVLAEIEALEGTARMMSANWDAAVGGSGGATQIFVPEHQALLRLRSLGPMEF